MKETGFLRKLIGAITGVTEKEGTLPGTTTIPDEKLIELFTTEKNESAFEEIVDRYCEKIYRLALRITRNSSDAEEVLQEVLLTVIMKLDTFRGESKFSSWLYRVAANTSYMHLRAERKHESDVSLEDYVPYDEHGTLMGRVKVKDWSDRPDEALFSKEAMEIIEKAVNELPETYLRPLLRHCLRINIEKAVNELPETYSVVFHLRDVEGLSDEEIAEVLNLSVPGVKSRLHRARLFLRDKLSDYFNV